MGNNSTNMTSAATTISIQNMAFNPNKITVKSGTNVQWINNDNTQHQIVSDSGAFQSNTLNPGDSYNFFFDKTGIFIRLLVKKLSPVYAFETIENSSHGHRFK